MDKKKRAFTLVELLVVISIIALLVSILMPALSRARAQAQTAVCLSNFRQMGISLEMYLEDNNRKFPYPPHDPAGYATEAKRSTYWFAVLHTYAIPLEMFLCPSKKSFGNKPLIRTLGDLDGNNFLTPADGDGTTANDTTFEITIGYNWWLLMRSMPDPKLKIIKGPEDVRHPNRTLAIADSIDSYALLHTGIVYNDHDTIDEYRHGTGPESYGFNQLFVDLHAETTLQQCPNFLDLTTMPWIYWQGQ